MKRWGRWIAAGLAVIVLGVLYVGGAFDRTLYGVGLNFRECARNGLGVTFCGHELDEYRAHIKATLESSKRTEEHSRQEQGERESREAQEHTATQTSERQSLEAKMAAEKTIYDREPETAAGDLAKDEYEYARAQLQQLEIRSP